MRPIPSLLSKELAWARHKVVPLAFLFVLLPGAFAYGTVAYEHVLPTDTPVAIAPQGEHVTETDVEVAEGAVTFFSDPVRYDSPEAARSALDRERVYAVIAVPAGVLDESTPATFRVYVDGSVVPYHEPSRAVTNAMSDALRESVETPIRIERHVVGDDHSLPEYLIPTFAMSLLFLVAFAYVPYALADEREVLDRVRIEASLDRAIGWKLVFFTALAGVPLLVLHAASANFGYDIAIASPGSVLVYLLTFVYLAAISAAITFATRFATWGRFLNVVVCFVLLTFSGLFYPAGFFSSTRRAVVRATPTHYSMVIARGHALRDASLGEYAGWIAGLVAVALAAVGVLALAIRRYERVQ